MYDTVAATIDYNLHVSSEMAFPQMTRVDNVLRMWRNPASDEYEPRLTYTRGIDWQDGRLRIEFSIPKMLGLSPSDNVSQAQTVEALDLVDDWLADLFSEYLPAVRTWSAQRIDYAWNFQPTGGVADYLCMLPSDNDCSIHR